MLNTVRSLDLKLLKVFVAVVENGGFSAAQASLNVGQSTISGYMRDLELRLGMRLCNRGISVCALSNESTNLSHYPLIRVELSRILYRI
jgi:hypothetical protein